MNDLQMGDQIVDHQSRGEMTQVEALGPEGVEWSGEENEVLMNWIDKTNVRVDLGCDYRRLEVRTDVLGDAKRARLV